MPAPGHQYRGNENTVNPFEERVPHVNEYTARQIATLQSRLDKQLGPEYISTRPGAGGGKVHYLAAEKVINLANEVFGFNGWSSEIKNVQIDFVDESTSGKISLGLSVISRVTLRDGAFHEDIGYGHIENCKGKAAAFEKAKKEAATDAMKRSLRNFGNVLGNCLYDKDYLARVTKVKVAPSKWDAESLHRHPDYAPTKKESIIDAAEPTTSSKVAPPARLQSAVSAQSNGTEYEDDYGGNLFDEVDFTHPDEVRLDDTPVRQVPNGSGSAVNRQSVNRVASMPALRNPSVMQPPPPQQPQQPARPLNPQQQRQNSNYVPQQNNQQNNQGPGRMMPPPNQVPNQVPNQAQRGPQQNNGPSNGVQQTGPHLNIAQQNQDGNRSNPSSASSTSHTSRPSDSNGRSTPPRDTHQAPPQEMATPNGPVGFVSGKVASVLNQTAGLDPSAIKPFDPHHESPSIRRTQGFNHRASGPILRTEIGAPPVPERSGPVANSRGGPGGPNGPGGMAGRSNFVNPSMDPNRRIGAPGAMPSPMANRNAYKPPSILKRPAPTDGSNGRQALTDVSNMQQQQPADGVNDAKKPRVDTQPHADASGTVS